MWLIFANFVIEAASHRGLNRHNNMENKTIRLIYPQWQGADIARWIPELAPEEASRGYYLGSMLLEFLAPKSYCETFRVPVSTDISNRIATDGVLDRGVLALQTKAALDTLRMMSR